MKTSADISRTQEAPDLSEEMLGSAISEKFVTQCWITSESVGENLAYEYQAMPGCSPKAMQHTLFVYENPEPSIPRTKQPRAVTKVPSDDTQGSGFFEDVKIGGGDYVLGYATGPDPKQIVSLSFIPKRGGRITEINPDLNNLQVGISHISVEYRMPPGSLPQSDGDYIAIKEGRNFVDLYWGEFMWANWVTSNDSEGVAYINGTSIVRGKSYLLGYYKSDYCRSNLAAAAKFVLK